MRSVYMRSLVFAERLIRVVVIRVLILLLISYQLFNDFSATLTAVALVLLMEIRIKIAENRLVHLMALRKLAGVRQNWPGVSLAEMMSREKFKGESFRLRREIVTSIAFGAAFLIAALKVNLNSEVQTGHWLGALTWPLIIGWTAWILVRSRAVNADATMANLAVENPDEIKKLKDLQK